MTNPIIKKETFFQKFTRITNKWIGKRVDVDKAYAYQCVDWVRQFANEIGYPITTYGNAKGLGTIGLGNNWKEVPQDSPHSPGDIVVFDIGTYGHIAVVDKGNDIKSIFVIEQNKTGTGKGVGVDAINRGAYPYYKIYKIFTHK